MEQQQIEPTLNPGFFRELNSEEEREFRIWARSNFNPETDIIRSVWHPIVREECVQIIKEAYT